MTLTAMPKTRLIGPSLLALALLLGAPDVLAQGQSESVTALELEEETFTAPEDGPFDIFLPDATGLLLGPGSEVRIDSYGYDPETGTGSLALTLLSGTLQVSGGAVNDATPITIRTPQAEVSVREGAAIIRVGGGETRASLVYGRSLTLSAGGESEELFRPEFESTVAAGGTPTSPRKLSPTEIASLFQPIGPGVSPGSSESGAGGASPEGSDPVLVANLLALPATSVTAIQTGEDTQDTITELSDPDTDGLAGGLALLTPDQADGNIGSSPGNPFTPAPELNTGGPSIDVDDGFVPDITDVADGPDTGVDQVVAALEPPPEIALGSESGFTPSVGESIDASGTGSSISNGTVAGTLQTTHVRNREDANSTPATLEASGIRLLGPTTNRLIGAVGSSADQAKNLTFSFDGLDPPISAVGTGDGGVGYYRTIGDNPGLIGVEAPANLPNAPSSNSAVTSSGAFLFEVSTGSALTPGGSFFTGDTLIEFVPLVGDRMSTVATAFGGRVENTTFGEIGVGAFTTGFVADAFRASAGNGEKSNERGLGNFIYFEARPGFGRLEGCEVSLPCDLEEITDELVLELEENLSPSELAQLDLPDPGVRYVFAAGDVDGAARSGGFSGLQRDRFQITSGLQDTEGAVSFRTDQRSFLRNETWTDLGDGLSPDDLSDTGFLTVTPASITNPATGPQVSIPGVQDDVGNFSLSRSELSKLPPAVQTLWNSPVLHADFGLANLDDGQVSTISATIGDVTYRQSNSLTFERVSDPFEDDITDVSNVIVVETVDGDGDPIPLERLDSQGEPFFEVVEVDAITRARTIGSSSTGASGSVSLTGDVQSTSAGGGNPVTGDRMGYVVLENTGPVFDDVTNGIQTLNCDGSSCLPAETLLGGVERPVGSDTESGFGIIRLGQAIDTEAVSSGNRASAGMTGFAAAFTEIELVDGGVSLTTFLPPEDAGLALPSDEPNLTLDPIAADAVTFTATLDDGTTPHALGGEGSSAYITPGEYGALTDGTTGDLALVSGDLVKDQLAGKFSDSEGATVPVPPDYEHVKWGFFFGDAIREIEGEMLASHVHLGSFVAGETWDTADLIGTSGTATYSGHALGNVISDGRIRTVVGTFKDSFNFDQRAGSVTMDFDQRRFSGISTLSDARYRSEISGSDDIRGNLAGRFVGPKGAAQPKGLIGRFQLRNTSGDAQTSYQATGTFAGERP